MRVFELILLREMHLQSSKPWVMPWFIYHCHLIYLPLSLYSNNTGTFGKMKTKYQGWKYSYYTVSLSFAYSGEGDFFFFRAIYLLLHFLLYLLKLCSATLTYFPCPKKKKKNSFLKWVFLTLSVAHSSMSCWDLNYRNGSRAPDVKISKSLFYYKDQFI